MNTDEITRALVVWTGWGVAEKPQRDDNAVIHSYGATLGPALLQRIRALEADFYASDAHATAGDLPTMAENSTTEFMAKHPELPPEAAYALAWCYTFDFK